MISIDRALELLAETASPMPSREVPLRDALHRVAATDVASSVSLPPFPQSAMDGYAIRAAETRDASESEPVQLRVVGEVAAGESRSLPEIQAGEAARIFTGGRVPPGADTIVRQERVDASDDSITVDSPVPEGKDLRPVGEELEEGEPLVAVGERLDERHLAALSMTGHPRVAVHAEPRIAVLVSGDEVVPPSADRKSNEIYDANLPFLRGFLDRLGYSKTSFERLEDDPDRVETTLERALETSDLVVSTGGVAVGDHDHLHRAVEHLGGERLFWQVDQKPGRPVYLGERDGTPFLGLPGNPGAVFVNTHVYLTRLLDRIEGRSALRPRFRSGELAGPIEPSSKRPRWSPCRRVETDDAVVCLDPIDRGRAHRLGRLARADALVRVEAGDEPLETGSRVRWLATCDHPRPSAGAHETGG